jgi:hypothetical protein
MDTGRAGMWVAQMSLWWLIPIALAVLGFWATTWADIPLTAEEEKDWVDYYEKEYDDER